MIRGFLQFFLLAALATSALAQSAALETDHVYRIFLTDVDGRQLSTVDGAVTIITVTTRDDEQKATAVGDEVPLQYVGDPRYRLITIINFQKTIRSFFRRITLTIIRRRLDAEAKRIQPKYSAKHLTRPPRRDIFVVADFDGNAVSQLRIAPSSVECLIFVFDGEGRLLRHWSDVPPAAGLAQVLARAKPR